MQNATVTYLLAKTRRYWVSSFILLTLKMSVANR
jgi:hypothetical protein